MISIRNTIDFLNEAEELFPVVDWEIDGVHAWPLLRMRYGFAMLQRQGHPAPTAGGAFRRAWTSLIGPAQRSMATLRDPAHNLDRSLPLQVVLLCSGNAYSQVGGTWVDRFCGPLIGEFEQRGFRCGLISPLHRYRVPRQSSSYFVQPELDRIALLSIIRRSRHEKLPELAAFHRWASSLGAPPPTLAWLRRAAVRVRATADFYGTLLKRTGASLGIVVNYYSLGGMSFTLACRNQRLPVVDIQHGVAGDLHLAYGRWIRIPQHGFNLLPTHFWCWDATAAAAINNWAAHTHHTVIGGNIGLTLSSGRLEWAGDVQEPVRRVKSRYQGMIHVLVTLQFPLANENTQALLAMVRGSASNIFWWIRLHPSMLHERRRLAVLLRGVERVELDTATELPLIAVLPNMDAHVTHSSSTVLEAASVGVPSVITSTYGADLYGEQIRSGLALQADEFVEALLPPRRRVAPVPAFTGAAVEALLQAANLTTPTLVETA